MKVFVTGGTGFIGRQVVDELLGAGHTLLVFSKHAPPREIKEKASKRLVFLRGDLARLSRHERRIRKFRPEVAIHLAWEGIPSDDSALCERNLRNGLAVIRLLARLGCQCVIGAGSCHEYGEPQGRVNESAPLRPYNALYDAKVALYRLGSKIAAEGGMKFIWLRLFFVYGPGQRQKSLIPYLSVSLRAGKKVAFRTPRGGNDFIFVTDVARALRLVTASYKKLGNTVYNVGSGRLTSVAEVAKRVSSFYGKPAPLRAPRRILGFWADISRMKKAVGWRPVVSVREGIERTLRALD